MSRPLRFPVFHFLPHIQYGLLSVLMMMAIPAQAAGGATARTLAQPLLAAFQHSIVTSRALGTQSKDSLSCIAALPKDSFSDLIQEALNQGLSNAELTAIDAYFSRPAFSAEIPHLLAQLQGMKLSNTNLVRAPLTDADKKLESTLLNGDILHKLTSAEYFKTAQVFAAFDAKSKDLLWQCGIRKNDLRDPWRLMV
ncbi:MAG: hypothetical protein Q7T62_09780 [Undibacterium sp.]|nr:hypothetical protein [Undibacterium sp.]